MTENELRSRVCDLAESWVGKRQADGSHREIIDIYNQIRPLPRGYKMSYTDFWCAATVSALAQALGLTDYIFPECSCDRMIQLYKQHGRWMEDDAYVPQPADVIFYDWDDSGVGDNTGASDHVGTVISVSGSVINIIEGNCGKAVQWTARQVNTRYIRGYGLPDYAAAAAELTEDEPVEAPEVVIIPDDGEDTNVPATQEETVTMPALRPGWCYVALPILEVGDESEAVRAAQYLLKGRVFPVGWMGADGEFGDKTQSAVGKFQRDRDLERDGVIGPETWSKLICD